MKAKLTIDGKEFDIEIYDPAMIEVLTNQAEPTNTGYERVKNGEYYYIDDGMGGVEKVMENHDSADKNLYDGGYYFSDLELANNNVRADALMRKLRRFAAEENKRCVDWSSDGYRRVIYYDHITKTLFYYNYTTMQTFGAIAFDSDEGVKKAMEIFRDELIWYFTEYKDNLRG